jgi:hypothetical protein
MQLTTLRWDRGSHRALRCFDRHHRGRGLLEEPGRGRDAGQSEDDRQAKGWRVAEDARQGQAGGPGEQGAEMVT